MNAARLNFCWRTAIINN